MSRSPSCRPGPRNDLPLVEVDRHQLKQAFYNVIKNAFQAMKTGGLLKIRTDLEEQFIAISFADSGGGVEAHLRKVLQAVPK